MPTHSGNFWLSYAQMTDNAQYILDYLLLRGWTKNAVCGMLGNMQTESTINPGIWQNLDEGNLSLGFGLVQWTPATKYLDWASDRSLVPGAINSNLARILYEVENNAQWGNDINGNPPPFNFEDFTHSTLSAYTLGMYFLIYYERPQDINQPQRGEQASAWFNLLEGGGGEPGGGGGYTRNKNLKLLFCLKRRKLF